MFILILSGIVARPKMRNVLSINQLQYQKADEIKLTSKQKWHYRLRWFTLVSGMAWLLVCELFPAIINLFRVKKLETVKGQLCLVSGGANGFGRALAMRFAEEGCDIAICDIVNCDQTVHEIQEKFRVKCQGFTCDVADNDSVEELKRYVEAAMGTVDILVNNAGLLLLTPLLSTSNENVDRCIAVNLGSHCKVSA